jgi:hypothetical protein
MKKYGRHFRIQKQVMLEKLGKGGPESVDTAPVRIQSDGIKALKASLATMMSSVEKQNKLMEKSAETLNSLSENITQVVKALRNLNASNGVCSGLFQFASFSRHGMAIFPSLSLFSFSLFSPFSFFFSSR